MVLPENLKSSGVKVDHLGPILEPSVSGFDDGATTFCSAFIDPGEPKRKYLYYTGADVNWSHAAIGVATSTDGINFRKEDGVNPVVDGGNGDFNSRESVTPAVTAIYGNYYMFFAGRGSGSRLLGGGRRVGFAVADDPLGPWEVVGTVARPKSWWEGWSIDLGPSISSPSEGTLLVYYSNVDMKLSPIRKNSPESLRRMIGILVVKIKSRRRVKAFRSAGNPLRALNGDQGSRNESVFCPGYFSHAGRHAILPAMSTYSLGYPYRQSIGIAFGNSPYFSDITGPSLLIDGPSEKEKILPGISGEIALDSPSILQGDGKLMLYYSAMDRKDGKWKEVVSSVGKGPFMVGVN
jgi:hypothetical protein